MALHFIFQINLKCHLEAHKKSSAKSLCNILASFSGVIDLQGTVSSGNKRKLVFEERLSPMSLIDKHQEKEGTQNSSLWDTRQEFNRCRAFSADDFSLISLVSFTSTIKSDFRFNYTVKCLISLGICQGCKLLCHSISGVTVI